jgi:hypothetical protein
MPWFFGVVERKHELQNPTSPAKILLLGERLGLGPKLLGWAIIVARKR